MSKQKNEFKLIFYFIFLISARWSRYGIPNRIMRAHRPMMWWSWRLKLGSRGGVRVGSRAKVAAFSDFRSNGEDGRGRIRPWILLRREEARPQPSRPNRYRFPSRFWCLLVFFFWVVAAAGACVIAWVHRILWGVLFELMWESLHFLVGWDCWFAGLMLE